VITGYSKGRPKSIFLELGHGGGTITRKLFFAVLLFFSIASVCLGNVTALEQNKTVNKTQLSIVEDLNQQKSLIQTQNQKSSEKSKIINQTKISSLTVSNLNSTNSTSYQYLKSTKNCQVNDSKIKSLATSLTKDTTRSTNSSYQKAVKIFNWVRDKINYIFYYNTKNGAVGTLRNKTGNCVDITHLLVALSRSAGIPTRYAHGECKFSSGKTYGHVWAQLYVNNKWYSADASNSKNIFGTIKSWDTSNYSLKGIYAELPF